jgi:hypothetical protein
MAPVLPMAQVPVPEEAPVARAVFANCSPYQSRGGFTGKPAWVSSSTYFPMAGLRVPRTVAVCIEGALKDLASINHIALNFFKLC